MSIQESPKKPLLVLDNVSLKPKDMERVIIQNLNFSLYEGDCVILLGGNGSGKSSLIKLMNNTTSPTQGTIKWLDGCSTAQNRPKDIITLTQDMSHSLFYDLTVFENCLLWGLKDKPLSLKIRTHDERLYYAEYLKGYHPNLALKLDNVLRTLSGGEKQALLLALCLAAKPKILFLDEHTSALDPVQSEQMMQLTFEALQTHRITSVIITHNLNHALEFGNRLIALKDGAIVFKADTLEKEKLQRHELVRFCF